MRSFENYRWQQNNLNNLPNGAWVSKLFGKHVAVIIPHKIKGIEYLKFTIWWWDYRKNNLGTCASVVVDLRADTTEERELRGWAEAVRLAAQSPRYCSSCRNRQLLTPVKGEGGMPAKRLTCRSKFHIRKSGLPNCRRR